MSTRRFSNEQIKVLLKNPNAEGCSEKSIKYSKSFKVAAVREWQAGVSPQQIFTQAGFDTYAIGKKKPKDCLLRWRRIFKKKGEEGLRT
ncbi:MAG TPA: IS3 family transposase, partial [Candidatus Moranbacteria bacterium]|nr:IS3 family transposase [Candidatus Moranbacteria bacterium]